MSPASPAYNALDCADAHVVGIRDFLGTHGGVAVADFPDGLLIEHSVSVVGALGCIGVSADSSQDFVTMDHVILGGNYFDIFDTVIIFDSVNMVDVVTFWYGADKSLYDQPVHFEGFDVRSSGISGDNGVTVLVSTASNDAATSTNNPTLARHLVPTFDVLPNLHVNLRMGSHEHHTERKG